MKKILLLGFFTIFAVLTVFADNAALIDAVRNRNETKLAHELQYNWVSDKNAVIDGKTALMLAAEQGWRRGVDMILQKRADPNVKGRNGENALLLSARTNEDIEVVELLINNGSNVNAVDNMGNTVLMYAVENRVPVVLRFLLNQRTISFDQVNNENEDALMVAARVNNVDAVKTLLDQNISNFSRLSKNGRKTAFMYACDNNNIDMVREFLESGRIDMYQDLPGQGSQQALPVMLWAINTNKSNAIIREIIDVCRTESLDDFVDRQGRNAWYYATLRKNVAVQRMLRDAGISMENAANTQR
jgi:ankyrin repeat protein